jgi:Uma2 family endonuclease
MTAPRPAGTIGGMTLMPPAANGWTVDELDLIPDDGLQYELLDGLLLVTPSPIVAHQRVVLRIAIALHAACPSDLEVFVAPLDWRPDLRTSLQPDVLVVRQDRLGVENITEPLTLAVEVLSPSTRRKDQVLKRSKYEDAGVESYWIVDPDGPTITAYDLIDGHYVQVGTATANDVLTVERPFPLTVTPSSLG